MERLARVEEYLIRRHQTITSSVFEDPHISSFSSVYYDGATNLQELHKLILENDRNCIRRKKEELAGLEQEQNSLYQQAGARAHDNYTARLKYGRTEERHANRTCNKCALERRAENLRINPYESPLPEDDVQAKAAIFALKTPLAFSIWRDVTWHMIQDLGRIDAIRDDKPCLVLLRDYDGKRLVSSQRGRSLIRYH